MTIRSYEFERRVGGIPLPYRGMGQGKTRMSWIGMGPQLMTGKIHLIMAMGIVGIAVAK